MRLHSTRLERVRATSSQGSEPSLDAARARRGWRRATTLLALGLAACAAPIRARSIDVFAPWFQSDPWNSRRAASAHQHLAAPPSVWFDASESRRAELGREDGVVELVGAGALFVSRVVRPPDSFLELLPSWNLRVPAELAIEVELQVAALASSDWSPWLPIGQWGAQSRLQPESSARRYAGGEVAVDVFRAHGPHERARLRIRTRVRGDGLASEASTSAARVEIRSLSAVFSTLERFVAPGETSSEPAPESSPEAAPLRYGTLWPRRSQRVLAPQLASRLCSPTSVAMVLESLGVDLPTEQVADCLYDRAHDLYGNWGRAIQGAFQLGARGRLVRVEDWRVVEAALARGERLVLRVSVTDGELRGAPYRETSGHLLLLCGLDAHGRVIVNDPAADSVDGVRRAYRKQDLELCWMQRSGVAYAFSPASKSTRPTEASR